MDDVNNMNTTVVNVKVAHLRKRDPSINNFQEWSNRDNTVYIGRNMSFYIPGANKSIWCNPFAVKKLGREQSIIAYKEYIEKKIKEDPKVYDLTTLKDKELGCWCAPEACHGHVLAQLANELEK